jgi:predicted PurR-regulated permease PerM
MVLGRQLPLNPVALFVGLLLWWFLWGIPGVLLAVPMMVAIKIFCDHIETLKPVGSFLGPKLQLAVRR